MGQALFGPSKTIQDVIRDHQSELKTITRRLGREIDTLANSERDHRRNAKQHAKNGRHDVARLLCREAVRTQRRILQLHHGVAKMNILQEHLRTVAITQQYTQILERTARIMHVLNAQSSPDGIARMIRRFNFESEKMEFLQEIVEDAIEDVHDSSPAEQQRDDVGGSGGNELYDQIMAEIQLQSSEQLSNVPHTAVALSPSTSLTPDVKELVDRLTLLKK